MNGKRAAMCRLIWRGRQGIIDHARPAGLRRHRNHGRADQNYNRDAFYKSPERLEMIERLTQFYEAELTRLGLIWEPPPPRDQCDEPTLD